MSYTSPEEVPFNIRRCFSPEDLIFWMTEYNAAMASLEAGDIALPEGYLSKAMYAREIAFENCKFLPSSRYLETAVTAEVIDTQGEVADVDSYFEKSKDFIENGGGVGIEAHSSKYISLVWKAYKGIDKKTGKPAIFVRENYFRGTKLYDTAWRAVLSGMLSQKSIGSRVDTDKSHMECSKDGCYTKIYADQWFELSSVYRGSNPRTYILDKHIATKGDVNTYITEYNKGLNMCTLKENYLNFKNDVLKGSENGTIVHYLPTGDIYVRGKCATLDQLSKQYYPDRTKMEIDIEDLGKFTVITKEEHHKAILEVFDELMKQIDGERVAIAGYTHAIGHILHTNIDDTSKENMKHILKEIIGDEQKHIGSLHEAVKILCPKIADNFEEGIEEAREVIAEKSDDATPCPEGQHEHAGVSGCHDITREHTGQGSTTNPGGAGPEEAPSISSMSNEQLYDNLTKIRYIIDQYPHEKVEDFLSTPNGKMYVAMYVELQRRRIASDNTENDKMSEIEKEKSDSVAEKGEDEKATEKEAAPTVESATGPIPEAGQKGGEIPEGPADQSATPGPDQKGGEIPEGPADQSATPNIGGGEALKSDADVPTAIANITSMLVYVKSTLDTLSTRVTGLENMVKMESETKDILPPVEPVQESAKPMGDIAGADAGAKDSVPPQGVSDAQSEAKADTIPPLDKAEDKKPEAQSEDKPPFPPKAEGGESKPKESSDKPKESEDKPKEDGPKSEDKPKDSEDKPKDSDGKSEEKKGDEKPADDKKPPFLQKKEEERTKSADEPADPAASQVTGVETKEDAEKGCEDKKEEQPADVSEKANGEKPEAKYEAKSEDVIKEKSTLSDYLQVATDLRDALENRVNDLRLKGFDIQIPTQTSNSISNPEVVISTKSANISIVDTPAPAPYTPMPEKSANNSSYTYDNVIADMLSMSSKQFTSKIKGEFTQ